MTDAETIERAAAAEIDRLIANDKAGRIRRPDGFRWLALNNLRINLARLPATALAELASLDGREILARIPGPTP
jgi:hypothetical protein